MRTYSEPNLVMYGEWDLTGLSITKPLTLAADGELRHVRLGMRLDVPTCDELVHLFERDGERSASHSLREGQYMIIMVHLISGHTFELVLGWYRGALCQR